MALQAWCWVLTSVREKCLVLCSCGESREDEGNRETRDSNAVVWDKKECQEKQV